MLCVSQHFILQYAECDRVKKLPERRKDLKNHVEFGPQTLQDDEDM
jgi:hypothetical protein